MFIEDYLAIVFIISGALIFGAMGALTMSAFAYVNIKDLEEENEKLITENEFLKDLLPFMPETVEDAALAMIAQSMASHVN